MCHLIRRDLFICSFCFHGLGCALAPGASTDLSNLLFNYWFARPANILAWILGCGAAAAAGVRAEQKNCRVPRHPSSAAAAHQLHLIKLSKSDIRQTTLAQAHTTVGCNNPHYFLEIWQNGFHACWSQVGVVRVLNWSSKTRFFYHILIVSGRTDLMMEILWLTAGAEMLATCHVPDTRWG